MACESTPCVMMIGSRGKAEPRSVEDRGSRTVLLRPQIPTSTAAPGRLLDDAGFDIIDVIMERIIVQMEPDTLSELDQAARESRMSRAAFVRAAVHAVLAEGRRRKELKQVVDSYSESPQEDLTVSKETLQAVWPE